MDQKNRIFASLILIIIGIVLVIWPGKSLLILCRIAGSALAIYGLIRLLMCFSAKNKNEPFSRSALVFSIIFIVAGILIAAFAKTVVRFFPWIIGIILILNGIFKLIESFQLRGRYFRKWWIYAILALVTLALGILIVINPFAAAMTLTMVIGIALIYNGVTNLLTQRKVHHFGPPPHRDGMGPGGPPGSYGRGESYRGYGPGGPPAGSYGPGGPPPRG